MHQWSTLLKLTCIFFLLGCRATTKENDTSINEWILNHKKQLLLSSDTIIEQFKKENISDSSWTSATVAVNKHYDGALGQLAQLAADSTDCIVTLVTFDRRNKQKRKIFLAAGDSTCLSKLNSIVLSTGSTGLFVYGKRSSPLQ
jgi:hypothetical protein